NSILLIVLSVEPLIASMEVLYNMSFKFFICGKLARAVYDNSKTIVWFFTIFSPTGIDCDFTFPFPVTFTFKPKFSNNATASIPGIPFTFGTVFLWLLRSEERRVVKE